MLIDLLGILAGLFVILAFYARHPARLRKYAIVSNLLFIAYGWVVGLAPVVVLHAVLLPLNWARLIQVGPRRPTFTSDRARRELSREQRVPFLGIRGRLPD
ncbi:MAG: hypothetical protein AAFR35_02715 [Pseudomonadota bacterium]